jgi:micrococcal nuclease
MVRAAGRCNGANGGCIGAGGQRTLNFALRPALPSPGGSVTDFCPQCGIARVGAFKYCRGCRLDFDLAGGGVVVAPTTAEVVGPSSVAPGRSTRRVSARGLLGAGVAIFVGLAALGSVQQLGPASQSAVATPTGTVTASARAVAVATTTPDPAPISPSPQATFGPTGPTTEANVVRVVDGDTIVVAYGGKEYKVRYIGMDTPETVDPSSPVQWMGPQASAANKALVAGKTVVLEADVSDTDRYGRLLRYVWLTNGLNWTLVNLELVKQGFASVATYPPDVRYVDVYLAAEQQARTAATGLWGAEPTAQPTPEPTAKPVAKATPKPIAKPKPASKCHPSYDPCLPIVDDLNCPAVRAMGKAPVTVIGPDDYRLDGNHDGVGCE